MLNQIKALFRKPTPLERAVKELGRIDHAILDVTAEIRWAQKRYEYHVDRRAELHEFIQRGTK